MNKTFGILAHVDAGKTTFSEQLLFHTDQIKQRGRVDHQNSFMDSHDIEKQRGITVFADQAVFEYGESTYYLIDTPGHVDFSPEMERAIQVMDYAVIVISAVEGVEAHTETIWHLLRKHSIPTFFFINKIDRVGASVERSIAEIRKQFSRDAFDMTEALHGRTMSPALIEWVAERDVELLNEYIEHGYDEDKWLQALISQIERGQMYPCFSGSALQDIGITEFLMTFDQLTKTSYSSHEELSGRIYKIRHDAAGTKVTYMKLLSGELKVRDEITYGDGIIEKVTAIRRCSGSEFEQVQTAVAGELIAVTGLTSASAGDGVGELNSKAVYELVPALRSKVEFETHVNRKEVLHYFRMLEVEDPSLNVVWEEKLQHIHLHVMGKIQLEVLQQVIKDRFSLNVQFEKPEILYKETIRSEVIGYGHFEPLRHYAEVHLRIEPGERNSGVTFETVCHSDDLSVALQSLVGQHVLEREHHGLLTGSPLTDIKVTLLTGRDHNKHTHGGDFREATYRALRQGLEKADNLLLEPFYQIKIVVDLHDIGRVMSDIQRASGSFDPPETDEGKAIITGVAPVATFMDYSTELASFTKGRGRIHLGFAGYFPCHNEQEVIKQRGYDKDADTEYTSSSIFCAKGAGYSVRWDEAETMMHIDKQY